MCCNAQAAEQDQAVRYVTTTVTEPFRFEPGTTGARDAMEWLRERDTAAQSSDSGNVSDSSDAIISGEIVTVTRKTVRIVDGTQANTVIGDGDGPPRGETIPGGGFGGGGTTLPTTGTPGQTIKLDICTPKRSEVIYTYKWVATPPPGYWEVIKKQNVQSRGITCNDN